MSQIPKFETDANEIYAISENALMAHTIRAAKHCFFRKRLGLDIQIEPVEDDFIEGNSISALFSRYFAHAINHRLVKAKIYIRNDASRPLARFCIAHEIYHLLIQFEKFDPVFGVWPGGYLLNREEEDACDAFAWHLCRQHNDFYWDQEKLAHCRFGKKEGDYPGLFKTHDLGSIENWPDPFNLDNKQPFWKPI
jgi:hypothetical protein